ncbi:pectate lyase-domain-containing protein [Aspergillus karnatakaensis]|uniref:pectate lyase n=1 Tax=Aspergillus karnatakaensis TaxID=1810916 RepID=UPI003CCDC1D0
MPILSKILSLSLLTTALAAPSFPHRRYTQAPTLQKRQGFTFPLPASTGSVTFDEPYEIAAGETYDGELQTFGRGVDCSGQSEGGESDTVFVLQEGATLRNAIIGPDQIEGVYCLGSCTIENVWWEKVCEDALSLKEGSTFTVIGGGAQGAEDKVIQHNSGGDVTIDGFTVYDFGKLYRSCGTCGDIARSATIKNVVAVQGSTIAGANGNFGDVVTIDSSTCATDVSAVCTTYESDADGGEPEEASEDPTAACVFETLPACDGSAATPSTGGSGSGSGSGSGTETGAVIPSGTAPAVPTFTPSVPSAGSGSEETVEDESEDTEVVEGGDEEDEDEDEDEEEEAESDDSGSEDSDDDEESESDDDEDEEDEDEDDEDDEEDEEDDDDEEDSDDDSDDDDSEDDDSEDDERESEESNSWWSGSWWPTTHHW